MLLVPWMVYTIVFLFVNTALFIVYAVAYFSVHYTAGGVGSIIGAVIYICK